MSAMFSSAATGGVSLRNAGDSLLAAKSIVILTHSRPDGDAIGSALAMYQMLVQQGKDVTAIVEGGTPERYEFLSGSERIKSHTDFSEKSLSAEVLLVLDCSGKSRIGDVVWNVLGDFDRVINLDHHRSNDMFGDLNYVPDEPATGVIVHHLASEMGWKVTHSIADALFCAISTDTGSFRYRGTTGDTYRIAADLLDAGVDVEQINQSVYESYPMRRIFLLRELLQDMRVEAEGRIASFAMSLEMVQRLKIGLDDTEGLIDVIRAVDSVLIAIFFEELPDGRIRVSTRSKTPDVDVNELCGVFGGGGHQLAAGARMSGPLDEVVERVLKEATKRIHAIE